MMGGSLYISLSSGWFWIKCHLLIRMFLRFGKAGWYVKQAKSLDFWEPTPQPNLSIRTSTALKDAFALEVTLTISQKKSPLSLNLLNWSRLLIEKNNEVRKRILPFVKTYHPALPNLKNILMSKWHLIQNQPLLYREIYNKPPISLRDIYR